MLMSTSKELKDKYHYFVERERSEAILTGWVTATKYKKEYFYIELSSEFRSDWPALNGFYQSTRIQG